MFIAADPASGVLPSGDLPVPAGCRDGTRRALLDDVVGAGLGF
ncbi:hypothetical protein [Alloactinosynnema sp. L-07]|nr:hypothetical protein [Alloactinosynnema sp. L-07]